MSQPQTISTERRDLLVKRRDWRIRFGQAELQAKDDYFVMSGPSGVHKLFIGSTDAARLNAHWLGFATHPKNAADAA